MKLTDHFDLEEFTKVNSVHLAVRPVQIILATQLAETLELIRSKFNQVITITSGIRTKDVVGVLKMDGYSPSLTSDHSYLDQEVYPFGVGAVDFYMENVPVKTVYEAITKDNNVLSNIYQAILYPEKHFIHISNRQSLVFSETAMKIFKIARYPKLVVSENGVFKAASEGSWRG